MTDLKVETGKFTSAVKAEDEKAKGWIQRHPGLTLGIVIFEFVVIGWLALCHFK